MTPVALHHSAFQLHTETEEAHTHHVVLCVRSTNDVIAHFWVPDAPHSADIEWALIDDAMPPSDVLYLFCCLHFAADSSVHTMVFSRRDLPQMVCLPPPPVMVSIEHTLSLWSPPLRVRMLVEACILALPIWQAWKVHGELSYFDGVISMETVPEDLAEDSIAAVQTWLQDQDTGPLKQQNSEYQRLHWPMLEDEWTCPQNVYYSLFSAKNLLCAAISGDVADALTCIRQAVAARATDEIDTYLGPEFVGAFLQAWWRKVVAISMDQCPTSGVPTTDHSALS